MDRLVFNGVRGDTGEYRLPPMTVTELAAVTRRDPVTAARLVLPFLESSDLGQVGWGVIFPDDIDPRVREALAPLLELRRSQARDLFRELTYSGGSWLQFLEDNGAEIGTVDPRKGLPYYLLVVGSPQQIPFDVQYLLDVSYAVGRVSFDSPEGYEAYVRGVLDVEQGKAGRPRRVDVFGVHHQDDANTAASERYFVGPLAGALVGQDGWQVRPFRDGDASKARLARLLGGEDSSALLLTVSHGICFWPQDPLHASDQGGLLCNEWPGPSWKQRVPPDFYFAARDVGGDADLRGMITFHFACFSAGTPRLDAFSRAAGAAIPVNAQEDVLAALPQRLLGHPNGGALAVVGHVDQAWTHSFVHDGSDRPQIAHFEAAFRELMAGKPVGLALEAFGVRYGALATRLTRLREGLRESGQDPTAEDDAREALLWQAHNDARGYLLLGDPAVRLPAGAPAAGGQG